MNTLFLASGDTGTNILIAVIVALASVGMIIFLIFRIHRESKRYRKEREQKDRLSLTEFEAIVDRLCRNTLSNTKFSLFKISINNVGSLITVFGQENYAKGQNIITIRLNSIFRTLKLCGDNDDIYVLSMQVADIRELRDYGKYIVYELSKPIVLAAGVQMNFDISVGITVFNEYYRTKNALMDSVNYALVDAKRKGLNQYTINVEKPVDISGDESLRVYNKVNDAIKNNEFCFYNQPMCKLDGTEIGSEILLRWQNEEEGVISPAKFLPILEQTGNMNWIGRLALQSIGIHFDTLCKDKNNYLISQNFSRSQLLDSNLFDEAVKIIKKYSIAPQYLGFEIADLELMEFSEIARTNVKKLSDAGFALVLDHFNLGLDKLNIFENIKISCIKINKEAIFNSGVSTINKGIFEVLLNYCRTNDIKLVAMRVETESDAAALRDLGVQYAQGYLYGEPKPID